MIFSFLIYSQPGQARPPAKLSKADGPEPKKDCFYFYHEDHEGKEG